MCLFDKFLNIKKKSKGFWTFNLVSVYEYIYILRETFSFLVGFKPNSIANYRLLLIISYWKVLICYFLGGVSSTSGPWAVLLWQLVWPFLIHFSLPIKKELLIFCLLMGLSKVVSSKAHNPFHLEEHWCMQVRVKFLFKMQNWFKYNITTYLKMRAGSYTNKD